MRLSATMTIERKLALQAWIFLAVPVVFFCVIRFYPAIESFGLAFTDWNLLSSPKFVVSPISAAWLRILSSGSPSRTRSSTF